MPRLIECPACTRHVRADDPRCPFCGRASTTAAPARMLVLALPLTLMACTTAEAPPPGKNEPAKVAPAKVDPPKPSEPAEGGAVVDPIAVPDDRVPAPKYGAPPPPTEPNGGGVAADPPPPPDDRVMATKYGGPPVMDEPQPTPDAIEPSKPEPRPARKYGAAPKPGTDPLGDL